jgi:ABC-type glycerol-3-phosphate transport system substrate-binding protein
MVFLIVLLLLLISLSMYLYIGQRPAREAGRNKEEQKEQQKQQDIPTVRFAYSWANDFTELLEEYAESVKRSVKIEPEINVGLQHKQKVLIDAASGNLPDVFTFWSYETNLGDFVDSGSIIDVQEYFAASQSIEQSDFFQSAMDATRIDGVNYAVPYERFYGFYVVNTEIFDDLELRIPGTWEDIRDITPALRERDITPLSIGSFKGDPGHLFFSALTYQSPNGYRDTVAMKETGNFVYPGTVAAAKAVRRLIDYGAIPSNTISAGSWDYQINKYNEKKAAMIYTFNWNMALFEPEIAARSRIIPVPRINSEAVDTSSFTVGGIAMNVCINSESWRNPAKREHITRLLDWLLSDEVFVARLEQQGTFPTKKGVDIPQYKNSMYRKLEEYLQSVEVYGIHEFFFRSLNAFNRYKEANDFLWNGVFSTDEFLDYVQKGIEIYDE